MKCSTDRLPGAAPLSAICPARALRHLTPLLSSSIAVQEATPQAAVEAVLVPSASAAAGNLTGHESFFPIARFRPLPISGRLGIAVE